MKDLQDKVAVITGGAGGVGSALAVRLADRGCHLALVDISEEALTKVVNELSVENINITSHVVDITDKAQMSELPAKVLAAHGKVNILVNNAGITYQKSFETHSIEDWEKIIGINWWGLLYGCHYFLDALKDSGEGHIINLSSMSAFVGLPGQTSYCATKAAVKLLSESMWAEMEKLNIGVTSVHPGAIKTGMIQATLKNSDDLEAAQRNYELAQRIGVTPEHVAARIIKAIQKKNLRIRVGKDAILLDLLKRWFPVGIQKLLRLAA
ncbi:SDR family NAD(P)-dependent oxidoreductase [Halieaceae bacterium IMCC8485]|uniref:SDR family NAD(P)-dependent oxidoreductase n=1 Tax=Candidatus Seongchinamella marina TaxID=2518990 RepID=A0ABT3SSQ9_9GAMM|nr:SDR family NAD(P)-dependent oxidoreductase [Candidatus Seongchinamella marina]MCX2973029.1 SDR family NAD(P)-dependent oxidoreductase [Candidatus Seongchinamella marina]